MVNPPPAAVRAAFAVEGEPVLLPGGEGRTWLVGDVVLKPCGMPVEAEWIADVLASLPPADEFRAACPVRATDGGWIVSGWEAWHRLPGTTDPSRWDEVLEVGKAFHEALVGIPRPAFLDKRDNPWTYGERVAWQELPLSGDEVMSELLLPLAEVRQPVDLPAQAVHGDLLGNVMFADGLPPAIIDWPLYYRPSEWALAVAAVDALTWYEAPAELLDRWAGTAEWEQMLIRALMYRIATNEGNRRQGVMAYESAEAYQPVVDLVLARI